MSSFPLTIWESLTIAAFICSLLALIVAIPTIIDMICRKPRVFAQFDESDEVDGQKLLFCGVINLPLTNRLLIRLGVHRRPVEDFFLMVEVVEFGSGRLVHPEFGAMMQTHFQSPAPRVRLPASTLLSRCFLVRWQDEDKQAYLLTGDERTVLLEPGRYIARITFRSDTTEHSVNIPFIVGQSRFALAWDMIDTSLYKVG